MKSFSLIAALILATMAPTAHADLLNPPDGVTLQKLFSISNDRDASKEDMNLMVDTKGLAAGVYMHPLTMADFLVNTATDTFWLRDIESPEGAVLVESQGYKVILLQGNLDRDTQEGRFHIKFLSNGMMRTYTTCDFYLKKSGASWHVQNAYTGATVNNMKIVSWSLGISTLEGICPK